MRMWFGFLAQDTDQWQVFENTVMNFTLKMVAIHSSETEVTTYNITLCLNTEEHDRHV
jgi:peptidoglycan hydrolase-like amidase